MQNCTLGRLIERPKQAQGRICARKSDADLGQMGYKYRWGRAGGKVVELDMGIASLKFLLYGDVFIGSPPAAGGAPLAAAIAWAAKNLTSISSSSLSFSRHGRTRSSISPWPRGDAVKGAPAFSRVKMVPSAGNLRRTPMIMVYVFATLNRMLGIASPVSFSSMGRMLSATTSKVTTLAKVCQCCQHSLIMTPREEAQLTEIAKHVVILYR